MNKKNFRKVLDHIKKHPETWNQESWHCGSSHCLFGWAQIMSGCDEVDFNARTDGRAFFEISQKDAVWLSRSGRTIEDFEYFLENESQILEYDYEGYDQYGYDRDGYDSDGFNRNNQRRKS